MPTMSSTALKPVLLDRLVQSKVWGGHHLDAMFGIRSPDGQPIGETWELCDRPDNVSGLRSGGTLRDLMLADRRGLLGKDVRPAFGEPQSATPDGRVMQLWGLRPGETAPTSLALLPRTPGRISIPAPALRPVNNMLIEISLEPEGGSPTGRPTGPILFYGRLIEAPPN